MTVASSAFRTERSRVAIASAVKMSGNVRTGEWGIKLSQKTSGLRGSGRVALGLVGVFAVTTIAVLPADARHYRANVTSHERDRDRHRLVAALCGDRGRRQFGQRAAFRQSRRAASSGLADQDHDALSAVRAARGRQDQARYPAAGFRARVARRRRPSSASSPARPSRSKTRSAGWSPSRRTTRRSSSPRRSAAAKSDFAELMTRKARALGMSRTIYRNASGLPNDEQVTTARDQAHARPRHPGALPALLPLFLDARASPIAARRCAITTTCSAASRAWTASRPATPRPPASIS